MTAKDGHEPAKLPSTGGTSRKVVFRAFVIGTGLLLAFVIVAGALFGTDNWGLMMYPPVLAVLVFAVLGWLVWYVFRKNPRQGTE